MTRTIRLRTAAELDELRRDVEARREAAQPMVYVRGGGSADISSLAEAVSSRVTVHAAGRQRRAFSVSAEQRKARDAGDDLTL